MDKVLVIDDDEGVRRLYRDILEEAGYQVTTAEDGDVGIRKYKKDTYDAVILDIIMPEKEGVETLRELMAFDENVRVIAISGGGKIYAATYLEMMRFFGARYILEKPVGKKKLLSVLAECLAVAEKT